MNTRNVRVGVSIVNYQAARLTMECLDSISSQLADTQGYRVYVVDNASGDGSEQQIVDAIRRNGWQDWVVLITASSNDGFAAGNNIAIRRMLSECPDLNYVLLLNPDTVVRPRAFQILVEFMDANRSVGIAGGRSEDPDATPQVCCFRFDNIANEFANRLRLNVLGRLIGSYRTQVPIPNQPREIDWVSGAFMIIRRRVIDDIGLMDQGYFLYFEETDFTLRARRAGWSCWHVPASRVVHYVGQSSGVTSKDKQSERYPAYWFESRRRYFVLNHGLMYAMLTDLAVIIGACLWKLRRVVQRLPDRDKPHFLRDFITHSSLLRMRSGLTPRRIE